MPRYVFREDVDPVAYQMWPTEESVLIHESCAVSPDEREFPLYADDLEEAGAFVAGAGGCWFTCAIADFEEHHEARQ